MRAAPSPPPKPGDDDDTTVILPPPPPLRPRRRWPWLLGGAVAAAALVAVVVLRPHAPSPSVPPAPPPPVATPRAPAPPTGQIARPPAPVVEAPPAPSPPSPSPPVVEAPPPPPPAAVAARPVTPPPAPPPPQPPPGPALPTADEQAILADAPDRLAMFRLAADPRVVVLDFPSLDQQGRTLNRVAALIEKAGLPRDRVLSDTELDAAIHASGDTVGSYYYGHDYSIADLGRFFSLADAEHIALDSEEESLRNLLLHLGWLGPDAAKAEGALISLSRQDADPAITAEARATILHHELSHAAFFADSAYADYVREFWKTTLTAAEREAVIKFLGSEDYDVNDGDLMANEMQAYLMFTYDPRFFMPANIGMTAARRASLQVAFRQKLPVGWLRDAMAAAGAGNPSPPIAAAAVTTSEKRSLTSPSGQHPPAAAPR